MEIRCCLAHIGDRLLQASGPLEAHHLCLVGARLRVLDQRQRRSEQVQFLRVFARTLASVHSTERGIPWLHLQSPT
jgi:hypothetical protein